MAPDTEQKSLLQGCLANISHQSSLMKQSLSENNLLQALKHCSNYLNELRTSQLPPKQYYEMYMVVFDSLETLSAHLLASHNSKMKRRASSSSATPFLADLYELVQYSGNIIPRLYMMIVVGTTYMSTNDAPTKEIMKDMIEMCRGVQHPIRGLFLRYYLSQRIKDLLPLSNKQDLDETVDFLISNFIEMNKLWVRLQHQGHSSERELRYRERRELKILVGSNLVRLSQIIDDYSADVSYIPVDYYKTRIFPVITEQIIQCRDHLAQSYLIDVIVQIFPVTFHFSTLKMLLNDVFLNLNPSLRKSELVLTLVDRIVTYYRFESDLSNDLETKIQIEKEVSGSDQENDDKKKEVDGNGNGQETKEIENKDKKENDKENEKEKESLTEESIEEPIEESYEFDINDLFSLFWEFYLKLIELDPELPAEEHSTMLQAFIKLSLTYDPKNYQNLDKIYEFASQMLSKKDSSTSKELDSEQQQLWLSLLLVPIDHFSSMKDLLNLKHFYQFYINLNSAKFQKQISLAIVDKLLSSSVDMDSIEYYSTVEEIDGIFQFLVVLIKDSNSKLNTSKDLGITKSFQIEGGDRIVSKDFLNIQEKLSKILHLVRHPDSYKSLSNLIYIRKKYLSKSPTNMIFTYPTLIAQLLNHLRFAGYSRTKNNEQDNSDLLLTSNFKNLSVTIDELYQHHQQFHSEIILKFYLDAAAVADQLKKESIAYEFFTQCFIVYEENLILNSASNGAGIQNPHNTMGGSIPFQSVLAIANKLAFSRYFNKDNYENLITKVTLYGSKLLKKQDQCRSVYYCAHLWWWCDLLIEGPSPTVVDESAQDIKEEGENSVKKESQTTPSLYRDPKRVLECLQKSLRVADSCMDPFLSLKLFIEILNRCLIFHVYGNYLVDAKYINGLIDLIKTNLENLKSENSDENDETVFSTIESLFQRSLYYIEEQKAMEGRFQDIII
ncbi:vacuolar protein sorting-associated protein 35 [[Candida] anglica]|uniref:Vacuolar protein sorting-associated protein 35 n=1 Tax=[Candida] anglica TaxID=148631 RepID=A0ABP0EJ90_9ASCO